MAAKKKATFTTEAPLEETSFDEVVPQIEPTEEPKVAEEPKKKADKGGSVLEKAGKAALKKYNFKVVYVTSDGMAFSQKSDALNHGASLKVKDIIKVE